MLIPGDIEAKLGFDRIREKLINSCESVQGREAAAAMRFNSNLEEVARLTGETDEYKKILESDDTIPRFQIHDLRSVLKEVRTEGHFLEPDSFTWVVQSIETGRHLFKFLRDRKSCI
jgi:DNA mismatch repair protein MutS2